MKKPLPALLLAGPLMCASGAGAQQTPASSSLPALSVIQVALNDEVAAALIKQLGGESQLFQKLTGAPKQVNQTLKIVVPDGSLQLENLVYDPSVRLRVESVVDDATNCSNQPLAEHKSAKAKPIVVDGTWSAVRSDDLGVAHGISVSPTVSFANGSIASPYGFASAAEASNPGGSSAALSAPQTLRIDSAMSAKPMTRAVYRKQVVMLRGHNTPFSAKAVVNSNQPIKFTVQTQGSVTPFYVLPDSPRIKALVANGSQEVGLGDQVLVSADGAFIFGREHGNAWWGTYSVMDVTRSTRTATTTMPVRVWTSSRGHACGKSDWVLTREGNVVGSCDDQIGWQSSTNGNTACRYFTFGELGELLCYGTDIDGMDPAKAAQHIVWRSKVKGKAPDPHAIQITTTDYVKTVAELTGEASHEIVLKGTYTGERAVSPVFDCQDDPVKLPAQSVEACERDAKHVDHAQLCTKTSAFLAPFRKAQVEASASE